MLLTQQSQRQLHCLHEDQEIRVSANGWWQEITILDDESLLFCYSGIFWYSSLKTY